jgi:predicted MPP superfamily phosphohydrolase
MKEPVVEVEGERPWLQRAGDPRFQFVTVRLPIANLDPDLVGRRILFLTDLHLRKRWEPVLDVAMERFRRAEPDVTLFGGDLVEDKKDHRKALPFVKRFLEELPTPGATFAVMGNHDGPKLPGRLVGWPVEVLRNERRMAAGVEVIGLGDHKKTAVTGEVASALARGIAPRVAGVPRVVMCHYPYVIRSAGPALRPDVYLAGHTHGGQVCLPNGRAIFSHDALPKRYAAGVHRWGEGWLIVSRGLGFSDVQVRMWCPPEAHLLVLERASA